MTPYDDVAGAREATARLLDHLDRLDPGALRSPSLLPGWTRAHVVAHLAGNARSHVRMLDGCLAGEVRTQYTGGAQARAAAIEELAADPVAALDEHRAACAALDERWRAMRPEHWQRPAHRLDREPAPAVGLAWARWREVEMHRVDLGTGYRHDDWSSVFADRLLEELLERTGLRSVVADRVRGPAAAVAAWLSGRSDGADLEVTGGPLPQPPPWT